MNEFTVFLPTLIMIIQFISHTHNELFNSKNILMVGYYVYKMHFFQMNLKVNYAKYLIFYGLQIKAKLFSVSVAELVRFFLEF